MIVEGGQAGQEIVDKHDGIGYLIPDSVGIDISPQTGRIIAGYVNPAVSKINIP